MQLQSSKKYIFVENATFVILIYVLYENKRLFCLKYFVSKLINFCSRCDFRDIHTKWLVINSSDIYGPFNSIGYQIPHYQRWLVENIMKGEIQVSGFKGRIAVLNCINMIYTHDIYIIKRCNIQNKYTM